MQNLPKRFSDIGRRHSHPQGKNATWLSVSSIFKLDSPSFPSIVQLTLLCSSTKQQGVSTVAQITKTIEELQGVWKIRHSVINILI